MASKRISGNCACGNISFTSNAPPEHLDYCYCLTCQRVSGAPFMAWCGIPKAALQWTFKSEPFTYRSTVGNTDVCIAERTCCGTCGCNVILQYYLYPNKTHVAASTIIQNDFDMPKVGCHIWTRHVPVWHQMPEDGVERYHEFDEGFLARYNEYLAGLKKT